MEIDTKKTCQVNISLNMEEAETLIEAINYIKGNYLSRDKAGWILKFQRDIDQQISEYRR